MVTPPEIEVIADYGDLCTEGPVWNVREQALYWTDLARKRFYRYLWETEQPEILSEELQVSGYVFNRHGGAVVTNIAGIWLWGISAPPVLLASEADGRRCVMNDCAADPQGRVFSGSYSRNPATGEFERKGYLFRVDNDGSVHVVDEGFRLSNGVAFSPDGNTMYFVDSADRRIYSYAHSADGSLAGRRVLVQVPQQEGFPDGLTVDAEGYLWCAHWFGDCVIRYDPEGAVHRRIPMPATQISSLTFAGPDLTALCVTSAGKLDSTYLAPPAFDASRHFVGGPIYRLHPDAQGRADHLADVTGSSLGLHSESEHSESEQ